MPVLATQRHSFRKMAMNWSPLFTGAIGGILVSLAGYALACSRPKLDERSGRAVVTYSAMVRMLGVLLALLLLLATAYVAWTQPQDYDVQVLLGGFTVFGGGYILLEFFGVRIEFDSKSVHRFAPWHRPRVIGWSEVVRVSYAPWASWHVLHSSGARIRVPDWMSGAKQVVQYARQRAEANKSMQPTREDVRG
jgi:hypothetical protein